MCTNSVRDYHFSERDSLFHAKKCSSQTIAKELFKEAYIISVRCCIELHITKIVTYVRYCFINCRFVFLGVPKLVFQKSKIVQMQCVVEFVTF